MHFSSHENKPIYQFFKQRECVALIWFITSKNIIWTQQIILKLFYVIIGDAKSIVGWKNWEIRDEWINLSHRLRHRFFWSNLATLWPHRILLLEMKLKDVFGCSAVFVNWIYLRGNMFLVSSSLLYHFCILPHHSEMPLLLGFKALSIHSRPDLHCFTQPGQELSSVRHAHHGHVPKCSHLLCTAA